MLKLARAAEDETAFLHSAAELGSFHVVLIETSLHKSQVVFDF